MVSLNPLSKVTVHSERATLRYRLSYGVSLANRRVLLIKLCEGRWQ